MKRDLWRRAEPESGGAGGRGVGRAVRRRRGRRETRGQIVGAVPIGQRAAEAEGRLVAGHHEGDLIMGSTASNSVVGTIGERATGYLTLLPLLGDHDAGAVITQMSAAAVVRQDPHLGPRPPANSTTGPQAPRLPHPAEAFAKLLDENQRVATTPLNCPRWARS